MGGISFCGAGDYRRRREEFGWNMRNN